MDAETIRQQLLEKQALQLLGWPANKIALSSVQEIESALRVHQRKHMVEAARKPEPVYFLEGFGTPPKPTASPASHEQATKYAQSENQQSSKTSPVRLEAKQVVDEKPHNTSTTILHHATPRSINHSAVPQTAVATTTTSEAAVVPVVVTATPQLAQSGDLARTTPREPSDQSSFLPLLTQQQNKPHDQSAAEKKPSASQTTQLVPSMLLCAAWYQERVATLSKWHERRRKCDMLLALGELSEEDMAFATRSFEQINQHLHACLGEILLAKRALIKKLDTDTLLERDVSQLQTCLDLIQHI